jgi:hypothetical protein
MLQILESILWDEPLVVGCNESQEEPAPSVSLPDS